MKKNFQSLKKIIAGEGLVLIGFLILGGIPLLVYACLPHRFQATKDILAVVGTLILIGYPCYVIIHLIIIFVTWAIKTLKEK